MEKVNNSNFDSTLFNDDLAPVPKEKQTWTSWNYITLWVGMCICIPSYMIASSLIDGGMSFFQAVFTVLLGNTIVLFPMILNGHVGVKYGIPFPVYARLSFGVKGANIPALLRAIVACGWFGIQCWIGGSALMTMLTILWSGAADFPTILPEFMGVSLIPFLCFILFWSINVILIFKGIEAIKVLEGFCAPILFLSGVVLLSWAFINAFGLDQMLLSPSKFKTTKEFLAFFFPALTGIIGYWATLSLNIPDFTRYAKNQKAQIIGQAVGLPPTMTFIASIGVIVTMATFLIYGKYIWNPVDLISRFENKFIVFISMGIICLATIAMNAAANIVAPANDFSNLCPSKIDFKKGGLITAVIGILIMPWKLIQDPNGYIFTWLIGYSALLGPVTGILLTDYFLVKKTKVDVDDLYRIDGKYTYKNGYNYKALIALAFGIVPNIPGFLMQINVINKELFPLFVTDLYHYAWFIGLSLSSLCYYVAMRGEKK
jgi:NCS1 family nucleobase:cation symporter-1